MGDPIGLAEAIDKPFKFRAPIGPDLLGPPVRPDNIVLQDPSDLACVQRDKRTEQNKFAKVINQDK